MARGMAVYNPAEDESVSDVVRRADRLMYENKWQTKISRSEQGKVSARKPDPNDPTGESAR